MTNEGRFNDTRESLTCPPPLSTGTKGVVPCLAPSKSQFFVPCHFRLPEDRVVHQPVALRPPSFWFVDSSPSNRPLFESNSFELVRGNFWKFEIERLWNGKGWKESMNDETTLIARPCSIIYCCTTWLSRFKYLARGYVYYYYLLFSCYASPDFRNTSRGDTFIILISERYLSLSSCYASPDFIYENHRCNFILQIRMWYIVDYTISFSTSHIRKVSLEGEIFESMKIIKKQSGTGRFIKFEAVNMVN